MQDILQDEINAKASNTELQGLKVSSKDILEYLHCLLYKLSINLFQSEVATLNDFKHKHTCPTEKSEYKKINGRCFYFEKKTLSYNDAKENCREKLIWSGQGKLFEPSTLAENDKIAKISDSFFSTDFVYIGVTDVSQEGQFVYNSNGIKINFSPIWHGRNNGKNCICFGTWVPYIGKWYEGICSSKRKSICEG